MKKIPIMILFSTLATASSVMAGTVTLQSPKFDNICKVQITTGNNPPSQFKKTYSNVPKGFSISGEDRLCYRRSAQPNVCDSGFTEWSCASRKGSGTSVIKLI